MTVSVLFIDSLRPFSSNHSLTAISVSFVAVWSVAIVLTVAIIAMSSAKATSVLVDGP